MYGMTEEILFLWTHYHSAKNALDTFVWAGRQKCIYIHEIIW